jgi:hypothetical protein
MSGLLTTPEHPTSALMYGLCLSELITDGGRLKGESDPGLLLLGDALSFSYLIKVMYD